MKKKKQQKNPFAGMTIPATAPRTEEQLLIALSQTLRDPRVVQLKNEIEASQRITVKDLAVIIS